MGFFRGTVKWSPVEIEYLKKNRNKTSINQLTIALAKSRNAINRKCDELDGKKITKKKSKKSVIGRREDLNQFFRSTWEANVARWFNHEGMIWTYEPEIFIFKGIKRGTISYSPDFKVDDGWVEVKGQLTTKGRTAVKRFKKFYPDKFKKLKAIVGRPNTEADKFFKKEGVPILAYINELNKEFGKILAHWE